MLPEFAEQRAEIYQGLHELTPEIRRRLPTHRNCEESGMNALLDQLCEIQMVESIHGISNDQ